MKTVSGRPYWPARDPSQEGGGMNLYEFVINDGIAEIDLLGLEDFTITGNVRLDDDGTGDSHGDPDHRTTTSYKSGGRFLNADRDSYVVVSFRNQCEHGIKTGDLADITANGRTITGVRVGDVGPNGDHNLGEISLHAADELGVHHADHARSGPLTNREVAITINYHGTGNNGKYDSAKGTCCPAK